jgi:hypothetical protein
VTQVLVEQAECFTLDEVQAAVARWLTPPGERVVHICRKPDGSLWCELWKPAPVGGKQ